MSLLVHKAMTPEEKLKLGNIMALCNELLSAEGSAAEPETPAVEESVKKEEEPPEEEASPPPAAEEKAEEEEVKKSEEANADAEERMEELPEDDETALAVLKILKTLNAKKSVKKSKPAVQSPEMQVLGQTLLVMKSMQKRLDEQGQALNGILEGMGITSEVLKVEKAAPRQAVQPSANDILAALASVVQKSASAEPAKPETMRDALEILWR